MPFRFVLPPRIANATLLMSPVANPDLSAFRNHWPSTTKTLTRKIGLSLVALSVDEGPFHGSLTPDMVLEWTTIAVSTHTGARGPYDIVWPPSRLSERTEEQKAPRSPFPRVLRLPRPWDRKVQRCPIRL